MRGDTEDVRARLKRLLPSGWFGPEGSFPVVDAIMAGPAWALSFIYSLYAFAKLQYRIATATGGWLEMYAGSFFDVFRRFHGETDAAYSRRIRLEVFRPRNTRHGIDRAVYDITGDHPTIFEAWRPGDCGGPDLTGFGLDTNILLGDMTPRYEVIIGVPEPQNYGLPFWPAVDLPLFALDVNLALYGAEDIAGVGPTTLDILAALDRVRTASITYWVNFTQLGDPNP